jgi:hypothetical protein
MLCGYILTIQATGRRRRAWRQVIVFAVAMITCEFPHHTGQCGEGITLGEPMEGSVKCADRKE